ncbi:MAG: tetratricopeptide repeat protein, partial [bacterium]|nr:tetratricopeptide repeat protein [bacterium]
ALTQAKQALKISQDTGDRVLRFRALLQIGLVYRRTARYAAARPYFDRALEISRNLNNPHLESESLRNIAALFQDKGEFEQAQKYYKKAIGLARSHGYKMSEARSLNNLGVLFDAKAQYHKALDHYNSSLEIRKELGDRPGQARVLGNLCVTYSKLNQYDQALRFCEQSLKTAEEMGDKQRIANNLNNIGSIHRRLDKPRKAVRYYKRSLKVKRELSDRAGEARALNNIGEIYRRLGKLDKADAYLNQSLQIKATLGDLSGQSASYQNLALLHRRQGRYEKAKSYYHKALLLNKRARRPELIWRTFHGLSCTYELLSAPALAILYGKQALQSIQETRSHIDQLERSLRLSYLLDKERVYKHVADLLIKEGRLSEARQVLSLLKEEEYLHYLDRRGPDEASVGDVVATKAEQGRLKRISEYSDELGKIGYEIELLESSRRERDLSEEEKTRLDQLYDKADEIQSAFEEFLLDLETYYEKKGGISAIEFGEKSLKSLASMQGELAELELRTAIVTFLVLKDSVRIIITSPSIQIPRRSAISDTDLNRLVFELKEILAKPDRDPRPKARDLYQYLISPIEDDLKDLKVQTLMISLDGALRYLPFGALFDGEHYLAENYNIALFAAAFKGRLGNNNKTNRDWRIAGLGLSEKIDGFSQLPAVEDELDVIVKESDVNDPRGVLPGTVLLNQDFTAAGLAEMLGKGYPVIHLASHFSFRPGAVRDSFILLGDGKRLTLDKLESRRYPFKFIELLTLSACETAVGGEDAQGREIESFAALAQKKGADSVLATLWCVADSSTGKFMQLFYKILQENRISKAESLRKVQKMFLTGAHNMDEGELERRGIALASDDEGAFTSAPDAPYAHPYYWAPFILMGNYL